MRIRIIEKILYREANPLYILQEKRWWGWDSVTWDRMVKLSKNTLIRSSLVQGYQIVQDSDYKFVEGIAANLVKAYVKSRKPKTKEKKFKPIVKVIGEF